jgi:hypothetical protein
MNELRHRVYLDALGIDSYESRRQLPGAAVTRRVTIMAKSPTPAPVSVSAPGQHAAASQAAVVSGDGRAVSALVEPRVRARTEPTHIPRPRDAQESAVPRFSLVTMVAGDWLWLEELTGMPLTTEQVQLVQAMASALRADRAPRDTRPDVMQFDWPIHSNRQLDQGEAAARAGVAGFLARRLEQHRSRGLVLLGQTGAARVPIPELGVVTVCISSTADMLADPALKRQAWCDLLPLIREA